MIFDEELHICITLGVVRDVGEELEGGGGEGVSVFELVGASCCG